MVAGSVLDPVSFSADTHLMSNLTRKDHEFTIFQDPQLINKVCNHVSNGGSAIELAEMLYVRYSDLMQFINQDINRQTAYRQAIKDREEWAREKILGEIRALGTYDIRTLFNENGGLKPISEWPDDVARAVSALEISEEFDGSGSDRVQTGWLKKVKTVDRLKALEMAAKNLAMLTEKHEVKGELTLDQLIMATQDKLKGGDHG